jgi:predicted PurR-regulated permease PerM
VESFFFLALLLGTLALVVAMVLPYANLIILGGILAFLFSGPYERLAAWLGNRTLAAWLMVLAVLVTVLLPLTLAGYQIVREAAGLYGYLRGHADPAALRQLVGTAQEWLQRFVPEAQLDPAQVSESVQRGLTWVLGNTAWLFAGFGRIVFGFILVLLFFFFLLRDGAKVKRRLMELSPLSDEQEQAIITRIGRAIGATVRGSVILAVLQGLVSGVGFTIFGVPNPALWGAVVVLAAFVPTVGTALVQVPAVIYLLSTGHTGAAVGLAAWALVAVGLLDNFLGPRLMGGAARIHPMVMLLAVLGGITFFGPMGLLLGPILVSLLFALFDIYLSLVRGPGLPERPMKR